MLNFTDSEITRAARWIRNWQRLGGRFDVTDAIDLETREPTLHVHWIRTWNPADPHLESDQRRAEALLAQLQRKRRLQALVEGLALNAWARAQPDTQRIH